MCGKEERNQSELPASAFYFYHCSECRWVVVRFYLRELKARIVGWFRRIFSKGTT
jgi:hypothetical protein